MSVCSFVSHGRCFCVCLSMYLIRLLVWESSAFWSWAHQAKLQQEIFGQNSPTANCWESSWCIVSRAGAALPSLQVVKSSQLHVESYNLLEPSWIFWSLKIIEPSWIFLNFPESSWIFLNILEPSETICIFPKHKHTQIGPSIYATSLFKMSHQHCLKCKHVFLAGEHHLQAWTVLESALGRTQQVAD